MKKQTQKTKTIALMGILIAIMILMSFTPVGYFRYGTIEVSLLMIPVAIGAVALGPWAGAVLGGVFGITSFIQCFGISPFGTFLCDINPFLTCVMCIIPRVLAGLFAGLVAKCFSKTKSNGIRFIGYFVTGLSAALFNTLFFMASLILFFWKSTTFIDAVHEWGYKTSNILLFFFAFVGINCVFELLVTCGVTGAIGKALEKAGLVNKDLAKKSEEMIEEASEDKETETAEA